MIRTVELLVYAPTLVQIEAIRTAPMGAFKTVQPEEREVLMMYLKGDPTPGPPGPPGPSGGTAVEKVAVVALGGHRIVRSSGVDGVTYADSRTAIGDNVIGMTLGAAAVGAPVNVLNNAPVEEPSWNWFPDMPLYLGHDGLITQVPDVGADDFTLCVGFALSPTTAMIRVETPIYLED